MTREIVLRVRVDDPTDELLDSIARYNDLPKAQIALHFCYPGWIPTPRWGDDLHCRDRMRCNGQREKSLARPS